jgi:glycerol-3-phosphate O-acyltransferase / dihydroxyacetone phosphate acyltransferase
VAASADCERRDDWFLEQDLNAWSSLTYAVGGAIVAWEVFRRRLPPAAAVLAALLAAEGAGSWLYHGTGGDLAQFLHDVPLIGALAFVAGWHAGRLVGSADRGSLIGVAVGLVTASTLFVVARDATNVTVAVTIVVVAVTSLVAWRRQLPAVWSVPLLAVSAFAVTAWVLGRSDSALCDPDSWLQPHALWHLLTAVVAVGWVDHAYAADDPTRAPRLFRRFVDRTIGILAVGLVLVFHRSVDVVWRDRLPTDRPVLIVANHGNGFVDPVVVASVLRRLPRFLAKAALWKVAVARPFLGVAGVLPVYRSGDGDRSTDNASVFAACHQEFAQGATVAIFPEGTTGDRAGLDRVKSGAARIALGALPTAPDLVIVPIGLAFESKVETRSRVAVMVGEPIVVATVGDHSLDPEGEPDRDAVRALTARITDSLQAVSPGFADVEEREILRAAAGVERIDRSPGRRASFADREVVARRLARCDDDTRRRIIDAYRVFATRLELVGITEEQLRPERVGFGRLVVSAIGLFIAWSAVVAATLVHLPAVAIIVAGTGFVRSTATKGTVRLLLGLVTIPATWIVAGLLVADGWAAVATALSVAVAGAVALVVWPPLVRQVVILAGRLRIRDRVGLLPPILEARSHLVELVAANIGDDHD